MAKNTEKIEIKIEGKEWENALDFSFKKNVKDAKIDGFRKGAIPKEMYIKKFGIESLFMDAADIAIDTETENLKYSFVGWYSDSDFGGSVETKIEKGSHGDKEYFAKWDIITYSIDYNLNDIFFRGQNATYKDFEFTSIKKSIYINNIC